MQIHHATTADELADRLVSLWSGVRADPFTFDLAVVPGAGFQRWLSQRLATAGDEPGICAGVEFVSPAALVRRFGVDDPWQPDRLAGAISAVSAEDVPGLDRLRRHLAASRETWTASHRIARQFGDYARHLPAMLSQWADGNDVGPDGEPLADHAWQAVLWRELVERLGCDPGGLRAGVLQQLADGPVAGLAHRIAVVDPTRLDHQGIELYEALSVHHQVDLLLLQPCSARRVPPSADGTRAGLIRPAGHPLNLTLGALADENTAVLTAAGLYAAAPTPPTDSSRTQRPANLLGWLQSDLAADRVPQLRLLAAADLSVQVHLSHGPSRQVEVLREVLAGLLASDPSLEPRQIAVLTPDVDAYAPLLTAAFTPQQGQGEHPAQQFRLQVADRSVAQVNPLVGILLELLALPDSRAEASALLQLCANGPVAARFGFAPDDRERLAELVDAAGIRWGLSAAQRADYGLGAFQQNTWQAGLQRMLLGVAMGADDLVTIGTVLPLDDVDSSDVELIGGLTELVGRLTRWLARVSTDAGPAEWASRCREAIDQFVRVGPQQEWQIADLLSGLGRLAEAGTSGQVLSRHAMIRAVTGEFEGWPARGAFGNGSLVVCGLESLRDVPFRVVVLLGWDAERYPRAGRSNGDDLLGTRPVPGSASPALSDRQALLAAVHAAREHLVIVVRGRSEATNEPVPPATPIAELLDALAATAATADGIPASSAVTVQHPLQPFGTAYFGPSSRVRSYDRLAFAAARASLADPVPAPDRYRLEPLPPLDPGTGVSLDELVEFFQHPARALLKSRAGIILGETEPPGDDIPIEPDALARWQVGDRVLRALQSGLDPESVGRAERLRGQVPPAILGTRMMNQVIEEAGRTLAVRVPDGERVHHDVDLLVPVPGAGDVRLSGRVATIGDVLWRSEYSGLQAKHKLAAWLRLLALAAGGGQWHARVVGKGRQVRYAAPGAEAALDLLGRYLALRTIGLSRPLPGLNRLTEFWAQARTTGDDPMDPYRSKRRRQLWDWDADAAWLTFFHYDEVLRRPKGELVLPGAAPAETTLLGALASSIWGPAIAAEVAP